MSVKENPKSQIPNPKVEEGRGNPKSPPFAAAAGVRQIPDPKKGRAHSGGASEERIGVLGGSFDPVHTGHLIIAEHIAVRYRLDAVLFIPCSLPPHKNGVNLAPGRHRLKMAELAVAGNPRFFASDLELRRGGISYTVDTLRELRALYGPVASLYFIIGADSLRELAAWREYGEVLSSCTVVTALRPGCDAGGWPGAGGRFSAAQAEMLLKHISPTPLIDISSTDIRRRRRAGESVRYLVPLAVERYMEDNSLYAEGIL